MLLGTVDECRDLRWGSAGKVVGSSPVNRRDVVFKFRSPKGPVISDESIVWCEGCWQ